MPKSKAGVGGRVWTLKGSFPPEGKNGKKTHVVTVEKKGGLKNRQKG